MEDPHSLKSNEMAQCSFQPQQPLVCDTFKNCEGLSRVAFMDGNGVVMLGKVVSCERQEEVSRNIQDRESILFLRRASAAASICVKCFRAHPIFQRSGSHICHDCSSTDEPKSRHVI